MITHYGIATSLGGGYLPESVDVACGIAEAFELFADHCEALADSLDWTREACAEQDHYGAGEDCEDCATLDAYAELLYSTRDALSGLDDDDLPTKVRILGEPELVEYVAAHGYSVGVPNGTAWGLVLSLFPLDEDVTADTFGPGQEACEHVV